MKATYRSLLEVLGWACVLLAAVQLPGAVLDLAIRRAVGLPLIAVAVLLAVAALMLRPWSRRTVPSAWHLAGAAAMAFAIAAALAQAALMLVAREVAEVSELGILVPAAGRTTECRGQPRRCHELVLNELGFRGSLPSRAAPGAARVAFVGDSHVFGSGVGEQDTVPAAVARNLADLQPSVSVVNAGIAGINGGSFPGVIRHVRARLDPDVIVVLLKDDDLDETDKYTRWSQFRRSFWFRLMSVTNGETIYETARQVWRQWFSRRDNRAALRRTLDEIAAASAEAKLLVIAALADELRPTFLEWIAVHPEVGHVAAWEDPRYWQAERIPYDGHWNEAGCETIAAIVTPALRGQLGSAAPGARGTAPDPAVARRAAP